MRVVTLSQLAPRSVQRLLELANGSGEVGTTRPVAHFHLRDQTRIRLAASLNLAGDAVIGVSELENLAVIHS